MRRLKTITIDLRMYPSEYADGIVREVVRAVSNYGNINNIERSESDYKIELWHPDEEANRASTS